MADFTTNSLHAGEFNMTFYCLLIFFFKINFFSKISKTYAQTLQSLCCLHTQSMGVDINLDQNSDP